MSSFKSTNFQTPQNISNKNAFVQEKLNPRPTFYPGLVLIAFRATQPSLNKTQNDETNPCY